MVKYFCDLCGRERQKVELETLTIEVLKMGELAETENFEICPRCRNRIVSAAKNQAWGDQEVCSVPDPDPKEEAKRKTVDLGKVFALYNAGWSQKKISEEIGFSPVTVNKAIKRLREEGKIK